jgi:hypothetical protein
MRTSSVDGMGSYGPENGTLLPLVLPWPLSLSFLPCISESVFPLGLFFYHEGIRFLRNVTTYVPD